MTLRRIGARAVLVAVMALSAGPAPAAAELTATIPAADTIDSSAPQAVVLSFSEAVQLSFSRVTVTGPDGQAVATGVLAFAAPDQRSLTLPLPGPLAAGVYMVAWHVLTGANESSAGSYSFTLRP